MAAGLSFDQAPPIDVPYRFLLSAPAFGVAAGVLFAFSGPEIVASRWAGTSLAFVHLLTAGFMLQAMCGALLQFMPVATGALIPAARPVAGLSHAALLVGTLVLVTGFLLHDRRLFGLAILLLGSGGLVFAVAVAKALWQPLPAGATLRALRVAVAGVLLTLGLGLLLAAGLALPAPLPLLELTFAHAAAGFGAWSLCLLAGVCFYVVPMFQLTPAYPSRVAQLLPPVAGLAALLAGSFELLGWPGAARAGLAVLLAAGALFAGLTLRLQGQRRRQVTDVTYWFFRVAMIAGLSGIAIGLAEWASVPLPAVPLLTTATFLFLGAFLSVINGMLYKIVPFINWLHLQRIVQEGQLNTLLPTMRDMIPQRAMQAQLAIHVVALLLWWASAMVPALAVAAGSLLALSSAALAANLIVAVRRYRRFRDRLRAGG